MKNATETCEGGRKKRLVIIWCEQRSDNAKRCLCRANCPALCWVLVDVTFLTAVRVIFAGGGAAWGPREGNQLKKAKDENTTRT